MKIMSRVVILLLAVVLVSCATLFTGSSDLVGINSTPEGGKVSVDGMYMGISPVTVSLKRDKDHMIVVKKDGYVDATAVLTRSFNAVAILNLLSPICWIVDIVTGGMWKFDHSAVGVELQPLKAASKNPSSIIPGKGMAMKKIKNGKTAVYLEQN
jgi:hypothetical protein